MDNLKAGDLLYNIYNPSIFVLVTKVELSWNEIEVYHFLYQETYVFPKNLLNESWELA